MVVINGMTLMIAVSIPSARRR